MKITIALMMEAECTSETSVNINLTTWRHIPEDCTFQIRSHSLCPDLLSDTFRELFTHYQDDMP
jgi:hypothetical protein